MKIKSIDISYSQKNVDFAKVKKSGVKAVIVRTGYINKTDDEFHNHMKGAIKAGLDIGVYTYIMSDTVAQAKLEAQQTVERLKDYRGHVNYPVFCDMESEKYYNNAKYSNRLRTDIIKAFCEEIKKAGYYAALYINPAWLDNWTFKKELIGTYDIWLAAWTDDPNKPTKYDYGQTMWQWGTNGADSAADVLGQNLFQCAEGTGVRAGNPGVVPLDFRESIVDHFMGYRVCEEHQKIRRTRVPESAAHLRINFRLQTVFFA